MKMISLRFGENFAPKQGTIQAHLDIIKKNGYCWFGKYGNNISDNILDQWKKEPKQYLLLIRSGRFERYFANVLEVKKDSPKDIKNIPSYYRKDIDKIKVWFKIDKIVEAPNDIVSKCFLVSNGTGLGTASKISMNPCMFVETTDDIDIKI